MNDLDTTGERTTRGGMNRGEKNVRRKNPFLPFICLVFTVMHPSDDADGLLALASSFDLNRLQQDASAYTMVDE